MAYTRNSIGNSTSKINKGNFNMTKTLTWSEKTIGGLLMIWGTFSLFISIWGALNLYDIGVKYFHLAWEKISILKIAKTYHLELILAMLSIASGSLLILNKKIGWELTIVTSFVNAMSGVLGLIVVSYLRDKSADYKAYSFIFNGISIAVFMFIAFFLLLKPFRTKYSPTKNSWWTMLIVTGLMLVDKIMVTLPL